MLQTASFYKQEEIWFLQRFYQSFLFANGAGIIILTTYMGVLSGSNAPVSRLIFPLVLFILGALAGAGLIWYTLGVLGNSLVNIREQMFKLFQSELDIEQYQNWGFSRKGLMIVGAIQIISGGAFLLGILFSLLRVE